jgi:phage tail sheath gpL-like
MPFTSSVSTNVVTLTMRWKGVDVPDARFNYNVSDQFPGGVSVVSAAGVAGAGNPDITAAITAMADERFTHIVMPWTDATNLGILETELTRRFGGMSMKDGIAFAAVTGSLATASTLGNARNNNLLTIMAANTSPTPSYVVAAVNCAVVAGQPHPTRPFQTLTLPSVLPPARADRWDQPSRNTLLFDGISTHVVDDGGNVRIERQITTYQTNAQSVLDPAYLDVNTPLTYMACRDDFLSSMSLAFPRHLLGDDGAPLPPGQPIVTPNTIKAHAASRYDLWTAEGWVDGSAKQQFVDEMVVMRDPADSNRLQAQFGPNFMNQFLGMSASIQFIL